MRISVLNRQRNLKISVQSVKKAVHTALAFRKVVCDEISIQFVTSKKISELHQIYFQDPSTTDCISFPMDAPGQGAYLGEIFICPATAQEYALKRAINSYEEMTLYLIHGLLHLLGYDDLTSIERKKMRKAEKELMNYLKAVHSIITI